MACLNQKIKAEYWSANRNLMVVSGATDCETGKQKKQSHSDKDKIDICERPDCSVNY